MNPVDPQEQQRIAAQAAGIQQWQDARHRGGDKRNELKLNYPAIPLVGGPLDGQATHQPNEVSEVDLPGPDGKLHRYRRERIGRNEQDDRYAHVPESG